MEGSAWRRAIDELKESVTRPPTERQNRLAEELGLVVKPTTHRIVVGAMIRDALGPDVGITPAEATPTQWSKLEDLSPSLAENLPMDASAAVVEAWILSARAQNRIAALNRLQLDRGDVVELVGRDGLYEVSSIGDDGRVYCRGYGVRAWPDRVAAVVARRQDDSDDGDAARREAASERLAVTTAGRGFSEEMRDELRPFLSSGAVTEEDVNAYEDAIHSAQDEKPFQKLFERRPQLLAALLPGHPKYVVPKVSLSTSFEADFLLADEDSRGARWILVELESPTSPISQTRTRDFDRRTRKGISQIQEWRAFLERNLEHAQRSRTKGGLGLFQISRRPMGVVLVGRRRTEAAFGPELRDAERSERLIDIRTYDGHLEQVRRSTEVSGPPAANRWLWHS